jgi:hypothetical protein
MGGENAFTVIVGNLPVVLWPSRIQDLYSMLRSGLSLDGEVNSPCDNLAARICEQIPAERIYTFFNVKSLQYQSGSVINSFGAE